MLVCLQLLFDRKFTAQSGIRFSKYIGIIDDGQDIDLNTSLYSIYNAWGDSGGIVTFDCRVYTLADTCI